MGDGITLSYAKKMLNLWLKAEEAVTTGSQYQIGNRSLTRANISEIRKQIRFWRSEIARLEGKGSRRAVRAVPRDL